MTTRFCAQCGTLLEATAWYGGVCPGCGANVDVTRSVLSPEGVDSAEVATRLSVPDDSETNASADALDARGMAMAASLTSTTPVQHSPTASIPVNTSAPPDASRSRRSPSVWTLVLISAVIIALVGVSAYSLAPHGVVSIILSPFTASGASASSSSSSSGGAPKGNGVSGATAAPTTSGTPVGIGTAPPGSTVVVTGTPTVTGSPVPGPAVLSVSPTTVTAPTTDCVLGGATARQPITVANTGGQQLTWSVSDNGNGYDFSLPSGTLAPGPSVQVTVSHIAKSGSVTFSALGAQGSPQTVTIMCTALG